MDPADSSNIFTVCLNFRKRRVCEHYKSSDIWSYNFESVEQLFNDQSDISVEQDMAKWHITKHPSHQHGINELFFSEFCPVRNHLHRQLCGIYGPGLINFHVNSPERSKTLFPNQQFHFPTNIVRHRLNQDNLPHKRLRSRHLYHKSNRPKTQTTPNPHNPTHQRTNESQPKSWDCH